MKKIILALAALSIEFISFNSLALDLEVHYLRGDVTPLPVSEFVRAHEQTRHSVMENELIKQISYGNVPTRLRKLRPVSFKALDKKGLKHKVTFFALPDYLTLGEDGEGLVMPMTLMAAKVVAKNLGLVFPTKKMVNLIFEAASVKIPGSIQKEFPSAGASNKEIFESYFVTHNYIVDFMLKLPSEQYEQAMRGEIFIAGAKKDLVLAPGIDKDSKMEAIYGWFMKRTSPRGTVSFKVQQPLFLGHSWLYCDYSHGIRLIHPTVLVDDKEMPLEEILSDRNLHILLSDYGRSLKKEEILP